MEEEFSGLGSKLLFFCQGNGKIIEHDLENNTDRVVRKSAEERRVDSIMATPPSEMIIPQGDGNFVLFCPPKPFASPVSIKSHDEPTGFDNTNHWFHGAPPSSGFSFTGTCELADGAEAEALRDMLSRRMPETLFDIHVLPASHGQYHGRLSRKIRKAMHRGGYYRRNTKWKRRAVALFNRYPEQSPFTIGNAKIETDVDGRVCITGGIRAGRKSPYILSCNGVKNQYNR